VTKDEILNNLDKILPINNNNNNKFIISKSSGSSGKALSIYHKPSQTFMYVLGKYRIYNMISDYNFLTKGIMNYIVIVLEKIYQRMLEFILTKIKI